jgi:acyl carrier protein
MEADLGIDSIKRVEILGAIQQLQPDLPKPDPEALSEMRTLQQIMNYMGATESAEVSQNTAPAAQPEPKLAAIHEAPATAGLSEALLTVVSEKTGYPQEMLDLNMNMEADLGIDSIKRVEILGAIQQQFPDLPKPEPEMLAELCTLGQILDYMGQPPADAEKPVSPILENDKAEQAVPRFEVQPSTDASGIAEALLQIVSEKTGYPQEMLDLNMDMEADLGIDSIKRVEILGAIQIQYPELPKPEPETLAELRTIGQIIEFLGKPATEAVTQETPRPFA